MRVRRLRLAVTLTVLGVAAASCGFKHEPVGSLPSFPQAAQDGAGRTVSVTAQPQRIASLDAGLTEAAFAVGAGSAVVAAAGGEDYPAAARRLPVVVNRAGEPNMSKLAALHPDLVLAPATLSESAASLSKRLGAPVYVAGAGTLTSIEHDVSEVGVLTGNAERARELVARMEHRVAAIRRDVGGEPPVPVFVDDGFFYTIDPTSPVNDLITIAGGTNVAADAQPGRPYPIAKLRAAAPQAYLAVAGRGTTLAGLRRSRATRSLPAVRSGRFLLVAAGALSDRGPRIVSTLREIAHALHPSLPLPGA
jgi:ABC-type Fe3+-hydroxamate transport system substrate-binding protein